MSFLKSLIQRLLDSRTTPKEAAHNAAPGRIDIAISGQEYICPADGFVTASANAKNVGGFNMQLFRNGPSVQGGPQEVSVPQWTQSAMIPVAKGDTVNISLYNQNSWQWRFIASIGGGYNLFIWRALSCLRALSNFSPSSFLRVRKAGLAFRVCHQLQQRLSLQRWTLRGDNILPRRTVMSFLVAEHRNVSCTARWVLALIMRASHVCLEDLFQSERAGLCTIMSRVQTVLQGSPLRLASLFNLRTGGATC